MPTDLPADIEGLVADGDLATADRRCVESLQNDPQNHEALYWRGIVRMQAGQLQEALAYLQGAIEIAPDVPAYHANRGRCLAQNRQTKQAVQAARRALALDPGDALTLDTIGVIFSVAGEHAEAVAALERAVQIDPHRAPYWYNLGASRKYNGDFNGAEDAYRNALRLQPDMDKASAALAHLRRQQPDADQVDNLRVRLQNFAGDINDEMRLRYALAKALDDIGDAAGAFTELDTAAGKWRAAHPYDFSEDAAVFDALLSGIDAAAVSAATPGYANNEPVFIVGMPRTGTTLTERIVTSHSTVHAAGELSHFDRLIRQRLKIERKEDFSTDGIRSLLSSDLAQLGRDYIDATRPATGHTPHFVDKMPLNFMYAGIMLLALPRAKIICLRRNPMDTCLSNFRQLFSLRSAYYRYSYDLLDCGRYYQMFDRLMRHWQQLFPDRIYTQHYEQLVADQEQQTRALLEYCELDWEDACLRFEKNATPVATASSAQVRQPIYTDAAERWTRYREQLRPLTEFFATTGISV